MAERILVINPNSLPAVTRAIDEQMEPLRRPTGPEIEVVGLPDGPPGIESQEDADNAIPPLLRAVRGRNDADAYVIACYSDPGLNTLRELTNRPVFGIAESAILTALTLGARFGTITILRKAIPRHLRYVGALGLTQRMAGERAIEIGMRALGNEAETFARMVDVGGELRDRDGADVIIMGCAGMAAHRAALQQELGIPVVEPTQAAVAMAVGRLRLDWN
jgi:allantoin racemase